MLSLAKVARGRQAYYLATVPTGRQHDGGLLEAPGQWIGGAAALVGLDGTVAAAALDTLLRGVDPSTGEVLSPTHHRVRVAGYDCTFSTPKSVSLLHALGPPEAVAAVREAHDCAVGAAVGYLERSAGYCRRSAGDGGRASTPAQGFVGAAFLHRTSRAPDPHLHTHVLVANCVPDVDGRWSPLDGRGLFLGTGTASHLYEAQLRREIGTRLGLRFGRMRGCSADLAGFDPSVLRAFSRRSEEIRQFLDERGLAGPRASRMAALVTRPAKDLSVPYESLQETWGETAASHGLAVGRLGRLVEDGRSRRGRVPSEAALSPVAVARLLGKDGLTARNASFTHGQLLRALCREAGAGLSVAGAERQASEVLASATVVVRDAGVGLMRSGCGRSFPAPAAEIRYTTDEILRLEERLVSSGLGAVGRSAGLGAPAGVAGVLAERAFLAGAERDAVCRLALGGHGVDVLALAAGAGAGGAVPATDSLDAGRGAWVAAGVPVLGVAAGLHSARRLEAVSGIETVAIDTLGRDPVSLRRSVAALQCGVLVVGGADRIDPRRLTAILEGAGAGCKVVLVADRSLSHADAAPLAAIAEGVASAPAPALPRGIAPAGAPAGRAPAATEWTEVGGVRVGLAQTAESARAAALETCRARVDEGRSAILVAPDRATARALGAAAGDFEIVTPREVGPALSRTPDACVVTIGAAALLPSGIRRHAGVERAHVVVEGMPSEGHDRAGRVAEAAQPARLVRDIGVPPRTLEGRAAWRRTAVLTLERDTSRRLGREVDEVADTRLAASMRELHSWRRTRSHDRGMER